MRSMSNTMTVFASWNRTQLFVRPTKFRRLQNSIAWKSKTGLVVASSSITTTARLPKSLGRLCVSYHLRLPKSKCAGTNPDRSRIGCVEAFCCQRRPCRPQISAVTSTACSPWRASAFSVAAVFKSVQNRKVGADESVRTEHVAIGE